MHSTYIVRIIIIPEKKCFFLLHSVDGIDSHRICMFYNQNVTFDICNVIFINLITQFINCF